MDEHWNAKTCLSRNWGIEELNVTDTEEVHPNCPAVFDGYLCWGPTPAGTIGSSKCPSFKGSDITKSAFRVCSQSGEWLDREGVPSPSGWTNFTPCLTPEILEIMRRLGSDDDAQSKLNIAANTRILEFVCLTLSLAALLLSLLIFYYFRTLRNSRTRLHRHLFIAMVIQVGIRLIVYTDQAITRSLESDGNRNTNGSASTYQARGASGEITTSTRQGIDNTPILCEASYISLEYARTAMFMWMFVEGLFLHNMITVTVFEEKLSPLVYPIIGWILPIPLTVAWAVVTHFHYGTATCWWGYNFTLYFWILEGPRLAVLMVNLAFLLNILRVLVMKLRQSNSSETQQAMKAVKAALVLLPLLGLTNLLNMLHAPLEKSPFQFALWSYITHLLTSTQGFILAFLYCFRNGEVQMAVRKFVRIRILGNSKHIILARKPIPLSALDMNGSLFPGGEDDSAEGSCSQTVNNLIQASPVIPGATNSVGPTGSTSIAIVKPGLFHFHPNNFNNKSRNKRNQNDKRAHYYKSNCGNNKASFSSPACSIAGERCQDAPLIVRSYSNGVLKQTSIRVDRTRGGNSPSQKRCAHHNNKQHTHQQKTNQQQHHHHHHRSRKNSTENERLINRNSSSCSDDFGRMTPFTNHHHSNPNPTTTHEQQENSHETLTTATNMISASFQQQQHSMPIILPMTSSSSWSSPSISPKRDKEELDHQHHHQNPIPSSAASFEFQHDHQQNKSNNKSSSSSKKTKTESSWQMLIIPEQLLKRLKGGVGGHPTDDQMSSSLKSQLSPSGMKLGQQMNKQRKMMSCSSGAIGVVVQEDDDDRSISEEEGNQEISTSVGSADDDDVDDEAAAGSEVGSNFFSIGMIQEKDKRVESDTIIMMDDENNSKKKRGNGPLLEVMGIYNNNKNDHVFDNDKENGDEATVHIEILRI